MALIHSLLDYNKARFPFILSTDGFFYASAHNFQISIYLWKFLCFQSFGGHVQILIQFTRIPFEVFSLYWFSIVYWR